MHERVRRWLRHPVTGLLCAAVAAAVVTGIWLHSRPRDTGPVRVGYYHLPPYMFADQGRYPRGVTIDVLDAAAARLGLRLRWTPITSFLDQALRQRVIDIGPTLPITADTPDLHLTEPWFERSFSLVFRTGAPGEEVRVPGRSMASAPVRLGSAVVARAAGKAALVMRPTTREALEAVCAGAADTALVEGRHLQWLLLDRPAVCNGVPLAFEPSPAATMPLGIGSTPDAAGHADALRAEIARMAEDGTLAKIQTRWSLGTSQELRLVYALQQARQRSWMALTGTGIVGLTALGLLWQIRRSNQARRLAEDASKKTADHARQQERYRLLFERNAAGVLRVTADGRILDCNQAFAQMLGYPSKEELLSIPASALYMDVADAKVVVDRIRAERSVSNLEIRARRRDGSQAWLLNNMTLIEQGQDQPGIVEMTALDLTEQHRLEDEYHQAQKLESVGRLAGGVAHDFNNLLTAINGYSELALNELDTVDPVHALVAEIHKAGERAASLTQQLLAFSRRQMLKPVVLDPNAIVADVEQLLTRIIGETIDVRVSLDPGIGRVLADPARLHQILMDLAVNARDAMPDGGTLTLETRHVQLTRDILGDAPDMPAGSYACLCVRDTGHGMDAQTKRRVFEPFFTTKEQGKGTGLGLSTVYGIVKQSGGHVAVHSEPGRGSSFEIYLPSVQGDTPSRGDTDDTSTVLVVEDENPMRRLMTEALARRGLRVLSAADDLAAMEVCRREAGALRLLVVDVATSGSAGRTLAERLTARHPNLAVLFVCGEDERDMVGGTITPRAETGFLRRPFTPAQLAGKAIDLLHGVGAA